MSTLDSWTERSRRRGGGPQPKPGAGQTAPMEMTPERRRWLDEMLLACEARPDRLTTWEITFTSDIARRIGLQRERFVLTEKQFAVLWKIDEKIHAAG